MKILGMDLGKATAIAISQHGAIETFANVRLKQKELPERMSELRAWFLEILTIHNPEKIVIEDPPYVQNQKTYKVLCAYLGCVLATIAEYTGGYGDEVEVSIANNKTTKKKLLGDGNASKTDVWKYVMGGTLLGVSPSIQDEADAGLYALLGG